MIGAEFFSERQPAAVFKHALLSRYLYVFTSRAGKAAPGRRVFFLDGYAGPGVYSSGEPGSPVLAARTAQAAAKIRTERDLHCVYVERSRVLAAQLETEMAAIGHEYDVHQGDVAEHLPRILGGMGRSPLLAFFDPFGLPPPLSAVAEVLARSGGVGPGRIPTELLLNFSIPGLVRTAGHLTSTKTDPAYLKARQRFIEKLNAALGGDWWQPIWREGGPKVSERIAWEYADRLGIAGGGGWGRVMVEVARRWRGKPVYYLVFFSQHPSGLWEFGNQTSHAMEEFREHCRNLEITDGHEQLELEYEPDLWVDAIADNIEARLRKSGSFVVIDALEDVYGDTYGYARTKHLATAVDRLHRAGKTATPRTNVGENTLILPGPKLEPE